MNRGFPNHVIEAIIRAISEDLKLNEDFLGFLSFLFPGADDDCRANLTGTRAIRQGVMDDASYGWFLHRLKFHLALRTNSRPTASSLESIEIRNDPAVVHLS